MKSFSGIPDVDKMMTEYLDPVSFLELCNVENRYVQKLCDENMFKKRAEKEFPKIKKDSKDSWKEFYLKLIYWVGRLKEDYDFSIKNFNVNPKQYYIQIKKFLNKFEKDNEIKKRKINILLFVASNYGPVEFVQFVLDKGADNIQYALVNAAGAANLETFKYLEKLGANNYREALYAAKSSENSEKDKMIEYIKSKL
jgi:hypothetical protein